MTGDIPSKAAKIVSTLEAHRIPVRLIGALAMKLHTDHQNRLSLDRPISDIDFVAHSEDRKEIAKLLIEMGYKPSEMFNYVNPNRLLFFDPEDGTRVDVFLDVFEMCHNFNFRNRFDFDKPTLPVADLLATKLQIVEANEKDLKDVINLLRTHELANDDSSNERINVSYIADLCRSDWGIYKTFTTSIDRVSNFLSSVETAETEKEDVSVKLKRIREEIERVPKTMKWKFRARIGEKQLWYALPETRIVEPQNT